MFYVNNESMEYEGECQSDGAELTRETFLIEEITTLQVGDTFEVEIWYEGSEDINFYFNSQENRAVHPLNSRRSSNACFI